MKRIREFLALLAAFLVIIGLLIAIAMAVAVKYYGSDLRQFAMDNLAGQLGTQMTFDELGINVYRSYPSTSIYLSNVTLFSGTSFNRYAPFEVSADTLLSAERIYFRLNILELLKGNYSINKMEVRDGLARILIDREGNANYFLTGRGASADSLSFINIKGVDIKNIDIYYTNLAKEMRGRGILKNAHLEGDISRKNYRINIDLNAYLNEFMNHSISYLTNKDIEADLSLKYDNNHFHIQQGEIGLGEISASALGDFIISENGFSDLNLLIKGSSIDIKWLSNILDSEKVVHETLETNGKLDLSVAITGQISPTLIPHMEATFSIINASVKYAPVPILIESLQLKGSYSNGSDNHISTSRITVSNFSGQVANSSFTGNASVQNFIEPDFHVQLFGTWTVSDIGSYLSDIPVKVSGGSMQTSMEVSGNIRGIQRKDVQISYVPVGSAHFKNLDLLLKPDDIPLQLESGMITLTGSSLELQTRGSYMHTLFTADLQSNSPIGLSPGDNHFAILGSVYSPGININELRKKRKHNPDLNSKKPYPENIDLAISFNIDELIHDDIHTKDIKGSFRYTYPEIYFPDLNLHSMSGDIQADAALLNLDQASHTLLLNARYNNVDIKEVFGSFNNFGQDFITDEHIAGRLSGESELMALLGRDFAFKTEDLKSTSFIKIENGKLNDFEPIMRISDFLNIGEMDQITFSTIQNTIEISNNEIRIPEMNIASSSINLQASGIHGFDNRYEYHLSARLSDILYQKAKNAHKSEFDIAMDNQDSRTIFLVLYDSGDGASVAFVEEKAITKIKQDLQEEKTELKTILNQEFGLFKGDKDVNVKQNNEQVHPLHFEFDNSLPRDSVTADTLTLKRKWWQRKNKSEKKNPVILKIDDSDF